LIPFCLLAKFWNQALTAFSAGELAKSDDAPPPGMCLKLLPGYWFKVSVLGWISGGNSLGKLGWFPDLGICHQEGNG
jgi:hypothetical protein